MELRTSTVRGARSVTLNALFLDPGASGGPETYLRGLVPALRERRPEASLTVATTRRGAAMLRDLQWPTQGIQVRELPCDDRQRLRRQLAEQVILPLILRSGRSDVLHSLASVAPIRVHGAAHVITLHDVNFFHHVTFNPVTSWGMRQVIPRAARNATALITGTATAREDICTTLGFSPKAFTVIPHGTAQQVSAQPTSATEVRRRFGLDDARVVLCVGAKRPHKNQAVLVRAMPHLPADVRLVLVGHPEAYEQTLREIAGELALGDRVVFAGWVSDEDLEGLWRVASVAAFPTLAEGFGLPLVEAMARGVAVAASDIPVLREVGSRWPEYFDPHDPVAAAQALAKLLSQPPDPSPARAHASRFTWSAAADATWEVYDAAVAKRASLPARR